MSSTKVIEVRIWNTLVGAVAPDPALGCHAFEYDEGWRRSGVELAPLMMPTTSPDRIFAFPALGPSFHGLPGLLADALPDDFGNGLIDAWMARHGVDKSAVTALDRLAYMGKRGLGALEFRPSKSAAKESAQPLEMKSLVETARKVMQGDFSSDTHAQAALANIIRVGTSAGGARAKAVIAWNPKTREIRSGQFDLADGFEHWLLKFDGVGKDHELGTSADYGRIEFAYHLMATAAGIVMSPCRLLEENGRAHFMTRRFDRDANAKHHIQSLCALSHLDYRQRATHAYEQYFLAISQLQLGDDALAQTFRRMAFNVMARNCDDHTKNIGFRLKQGGRWELAPAYDVTHAHNPKGEWTSQHLMSVNGKFDDIGRADLLTVADRFSVVRPATLLDEVKAAVEKWTTFAHEAGVAQPETHRVAKDFRLA
ncbi:MAG TPA: type II toxin-antitoxin system HipA family toxin [Opitutaceae bacterium]|jgi:serine/threonine-protein kinase HipA|nr:type II toxin-antitoxin system HipA family toxin [Opitutaceae bacterium]